MVWGDLDMNRRELEQKRKENSYKVDRFRLSHSFGCVRINSGNTLRHETAKLKAVYYALKKGHIVATEVWSGDGKRKFDFFDYDNGEVREFETNPKTKKEGAVTVRI